MKRWQYILITLWAIVVWVYIYALYKVAQIPDTPELITCEERYIGDTYWGEIRYKDWDYIYLSWYHTIDTICALDESQVEEWFPLCGTQVEFQWPLDTSNMNCYYDNPKSKVKAFKKRMEDEKKEEEKYFTCNVDSKKMVEVYNSCSEFECARYRMSEYLKEVCPRVNIN